MNFSQKIIFFSLILMLVTSLPGCTKAPTEEASKKPFEYTKEHVLVKVGQEFTISRSEYLTTAVHWFFLAGNNPGLELVKIQLIRHQEKPNKDGLVSIGGSRGTYQYTFKATEALSTDMFMRFVFIDFENKIHAIHEVIYHISE